MSKSGNPAKKAINTAGQAFCQFTVIFMALNCSFNVWGNALSQSQSIGRLLFTQKICCVKMAFRFFRDAHQLLLVNLQVNRHHQLVTQLFI